MLIFSWHKYVSWLTFVSCIACSTAMQKHNCMHLTMTAVLASASWLDDANAFGHFIVEGHQKASHTSPRNNIITVFPGEYKYQSRLAMCITPEIHNMIHLYTIPFRHITAWSFRGLPWIFSNISLCCANFATLNTQEGDIVLTDCSFTLKGHWQVEVHIYIC